MPTSSQSQILSVVDYQLLQQQHPGGQDARKKSPTRIPVNQAPTNESKRRSHKDDRRSSVEHKTDDNQFPLSVNDTSRQRTAGKTNDGGQTARAAQRNDVLHVPIIDLNTMVETDPRRGSHVVSMNDNRQNRPTNTYTGRTKQQILTDSSMQSYDFQQNSFNIDNDGQMESDYKLKRYPLNHNTTSYSDFDDAHENGTDENGEDDENTDEDYQSTILNDNARRLLVLGTIRPSRTFYKNLSEADANHLMEYFRRMKNTHQPVSSEQINEELSTKYVEYKPKIFFDSTCVTKTHVKDIEKFIEGYAEKIRSRKAEFVKLENPMRFVIKSVDNDVPLATIPREYNDCFITLVTRSDPLRKSDLITGLVQDKFLDDVKANSLDISYFPGGVNYDVPHDDVNESGEMKLETYQKLKKRLSSRQVRYFSEPPEKKPNAILAIVPTNVPMNIEHQRLYDALNERLRTSSENGNTNIEGRILSIEYVPLSCIFNSNDISNQFIVDCDTNETKQELMNKPLKIVSNKQSIIIEFQSYDENMNKEYEKFIKSEKYRELIKNHEAAVKRSSK